MRRLARLTTMVSLMLLGVLLLASDSIESNFYMSNVTTTLDYQGNLIVSGNITVQDNDGDSLDLNEDYLSVDVELYRIDSETVDADGNTNYETTLIFSEENYEYGLRDNFLDVTFGDRNIQIIDQTQETKYKVVLHLNYDNGEDQYSAYEEEYYTFMPN